jgi:hypothetical protein
VDLLVDGPSPLRRKAKTTVKAGYGDQGDQAKRATKKSGKKAAKKSSKKK